MLVINITNGTSLKIYALPSIQYQQISLNVKK